MAPLCKFYQQGNCRNGANCRFEHPGANNANPFGSRPNNNSNANPFGSAPNNNNNNRFGAFGSANTGSNNATTQDNPWRITKDSLKIDLADERPTWILSCYGPGRDAPEQLFGGPDREQSLEEARLFVMSQPDAQAAYAKIQALYQQSEQQMQNALSNLDGAMQFLLAGANKHPNRHDICKLSVGREGGYSADSATQPAPSANPFGKPAETTSAFGSANTQSSAFGGGVATGGGGAFGSSAAPAFGQPSAFGAKASPWGSASGGTAAATPAFGQSGFGQTTQSNSTGSAFGQPSQIGSTSAFGQPSALGAKPNPFGGGGTQSAFGQSAQPTTGAFGQPAQPAATGSAFGQPSALGQKPNPFGAPAPAAGTGGFGQPASSNPFGQPAASSPFGQAANNTAASNQGMNVVQAAPAAPANPFGQPSMPAGGSGGFGQKPAGFGTAAPAPAANPFGQPQPPQVAAAQPQAGAGAAGGNPYGPNSQKQHPPLESYATKGSHGGLATFRGQAVVYKFKVGEKYMDRPPEDQSISQNPPAAGIRNQDGTWRRILFPNGPPGYNKDTEPEDPAKYDAQVKAAYEISAARGMFDGNMPEVPPMREDCVWNF